MYSIAAMLCTFLMKTSVSPDCEIGHANSKALVRTVMGERR